LGHQIIEQNNGKYSIFSTIVDTLVMWDATEEEIVEYYLKARREEIKSRIDKSMKNRQSILDLISIVKPNHSRSEYDKIKKIIFGSK
jgi:hypothetical protein